MRNTMIPLGYLWALLSVSAFAFENEPDGFRGIRWNTPLTENESEMTKTEGKGNLALYRRKNDKQAIGEAGLSDIVYAYYKGRFHSVMLKSQASSTDGRALLRAFRTQFGPGDQASQYIEKYFWSGARTIISLDCNKFSKACTALLMSAELMNEQKRDQTEAASRAGKDF